MLKRVCIICICAIFLSSCFWWDEELSSATGLMLYKADGFRMGIPTSWDILDTQDLPSPSKWDIKLAVAAKKQKHGFKNNMVVLKDTLTSFSTSQDAAILNHLSGKWEYSDYDEILVESIMFADGEESIIYIFDARYNNETSKNRYLQTAHTCNANSVYFITLALPTSIVDTKRYIDLIKTFQCNPELPSEI